MKLLFLKEPHHSLLIHLGSQDLGLEVLKHGKPWADQDELNTLVYVARLPQVTTEVSLSHSQGQKCRGENSLSLAFPGFWSWEGAL